MTVRKIAEDLADALGSCRYSTYHSKSSTSIYFRIKGIGTVSIRDHMPIKSSLPRLRYNLVIGYRGKRIHRIKGCKCYFYNEQQAMQFVNDVVDARLKVRHTFQED